MATGNGPLDHPQSLSKADLNSGGANGKCTEGPYCSTRDGSPSLNGNGKGVANGKPCAGCVGKADNKNPQGQMPNGSDHNAGYECDRNHGIGRSNPAHTGCSTSSVPPPTVTPPTVTPPKVTPPKVTPPKVTPPKVTPPKVTPPKVTPPKVTPPKVTPPKVTPPKVTPPKVTPPKVTPPKVTPPKVTPPKVDLPVVVVTEHSGGVQVEAAKPVVLAPVAPVFVESSDGVQIAAAHPLPTAARAGEASTGGQLTAGGFAVLAALLAFGAAFVLRRRHGDA